MTGVWPKWIPAAVVVPAVLAAGALTGAFQAGAAVDLPVKTPEQVLAMIGQSNVPALSGTLGQTTELGLPRLPAIGPSADSGAASALDLLTGSHTARIYLDGPGNVRVQVMDRLAERDLVRQGNDVWLYSSEKNTATHLTLPAGAAGKDLTGRDGMQTPAELAHRLLSVLDPSTRLTVGRGIQVAGRSAYDLVLNPRSAETLIGSVSIAVDSQTGLPLSVEVQARGQREPAFRLAFTTLSLRAPAAGLFAFSPPPGATVKQQALPGHDPMQKQPGAPGSPGARPGSQPTVSGTGWDAVIELPDGAVPSTMTSSPVFAQATTAVPGGRLLHTTLVNVLLTGDGRVFAGSVPLARLQAAADGP